MSRPRTGHRKCDAPEYGNWRNMICRCEQPTTPHFAEYGGRGIKIAEVWRRDFAQFVRDMGPRPSPQHTVDRIDVNGDYTPENCRWATPKEQGRNTRGNRIVEVDGNSVTLAEAVERSPVPYNTVLYRIKRGWSLTDALSRPAKKGFRP
jgi:hypothetical protein